MYFLNLISVFIYILFLVNHMSTMPGSHVRCKTCFICNVKYSLDRPVTGAHNLGLQSVALCCVCLEALYRACTVYYPCRNFQATYVAWTPLVGDALEADLAKFYADNLNALKTLEAIAARGNFRYWCSLANNPMWPLSRPEGSCRRSPTLVFRDMIIEFAVLYDHINSSAPNPLIPSV